MKKKLLTLFLSAMSVFFVFGAKVSAETISVVSDTAYAPFEFKDSDQIYKGIDVDIINAIAEDQGIDVEIQSLGFDAALLAVQSGQADGVIAGMSITDERKQSFDFSEPYFDADVTMAVAKGSDVKSYEDLAGKTVAVKTATNGADFAKSIADEYGFTVVEFKDSPTMYQDVLLGNSAACVEDKAVIQASVRDENLALRIPDGMESEPAPYGMGIMEEKNQELLDMFNKGLANIKASGEYDEILARYLL